MTYIVTEIQTNAEGQTALLNTVITDEDPEVAEQKANSVYHQILSYAALSSLPCHAAVLMTNEGFQKRSECYKHPATPAAAEPAEE